MARALIVDDNRELADDLVEVLVSQGHEAKAAYDGEQALAMAEGCEYDVALVDIRMPRIDGVTLVKELMERCPDRTYLFMTAFASARAMVEAVAASRDAVFEKPLELPRLLRVIGAARSHASHTPA